MKLRVPFTAAAAALLLAGCGAERSAYESRPMAAPVEAMKMADASYMMESAEGAGGSGSEAPVTAQYIAYAHSVGMRLPVKAIEPTMQGHVNACNAAGPSVCIVTNSYLNAYSEEESSDR